MYLYFMRRYFICLSWFLAWNLLASQNLVPNGSFEDTLDCPQTTNQLNYSKFWGNPTQGTPDYFNACDPTIYGMNVPYTGFGYQDARTGKAFAAILAFLKNIPDYREYIQVKLIDTLVSGKQYLVSFYVNLSNNSQYSVSSLGAYLTSTPISSTSSLTLTYTPQVTNDSAIQLSDSVNWMLIEDTITSGGTEEYLTIGNFNVDSQSDTTYLGWFSSNNIAYYYIDDVSVIDLESLGTPEHSKKPTLNLYPNPSTGKVYLSGLATSDKFSSVEISDIAGKVISKQQYLVKSGIIELNLNLNNGVYFVKCISNEVLYEIQKIIMGK